MKYTVINTDVLDGLAQLPDESAQCVVTSPPYWGLRDYGIDGQIGLEETPDEYVRSMVTVFDGVWRVLRSDGTLWLNLGDSYAAFRDSKVSPDSLRGECDGTKVASGANNPRCLRAAGLKHKDLVGIPWRVALELQAYGWYLRSDIIWSKPNPMPESVTDRPTKAHEYLFLLTKSARYYYDAEAIKENGSRVTEIHKGAFVLESNPPAWEIDYFAPSETYDVPPKPRKTDKQRGHSRRHAGFNDRWDAAEANGTVSDKRNRRSVWTIPTEPFPGAHFATFPTALVEPCILAGSRVGDTVLDPFSGSGTTGVVALSHQRNYVGIELNPEYVAMSRRRLETVAPMFAKETIPELDLPVRGDVDGCAPADVPL